MKYEEIILKAFVIEQMGGQVQRPESNAFGGWAIELSDYGYRDTVWPSPDSVCEIVARSNNRKVAKDYLVSKGAGRINDMGESFMRMVEKQQWLVDQIREFERIVEKEITEDNIMAKLKAINVVLKLRGKRNPNYGHKVWIMPAAEKIFTGKVLDYCKLIDSIARYNKLVKTNGVLPTPRVWLNRYMFANDMLGG